MPDMRGNALIRNVQFVPQPLAEVMPPEAGTRVISITGSEYQRARLRKGWESVLRLRFDDIFERSEEMVVFDELMDDSILDWLSDVEGRLDSIVVHCLAGISRSAAVARFIAVRYGVDDFDLEYRCYNEHVYSVLSKRAQERGVLRPGFLGSETIGMFQ